MALEAVKRFDPNEGVEKGEARFPSLDNEVHKGLPLSADQYIAAFTPGINPGGMNGATFEKAQQELDAWMKSALPPTAFAYGRMELMPDQVNSGMIPWPGLSPETLARLVHENTAPNLIIQTRISDVMRYSQLSTRLWSPGWRFESVDQKAKLTTATRKNMRAAEEFIQMSTVDIPYTEARDRDKNKLTDFQRFLSALTRDTLTYDGMAIWTRPSVEGLTKSYAVLPAGNIRLINPNLGYKGDKTKFAVLLDSAGNVAKDEDGKEILFERKDLIWYCRNPRAQFDAYGYGYSEVEMGMRLIQGFQGAIDLNVDTFNKCLSSDTEVLTNSGWKFFGDVNIDEDEFATINLETHAFEFQKATDRTWHDYVGEMYNIKSRSFDFLVTPEHRNIIEYRPKYLATGKREPTIIRARDLYAKFQGMTKASRTNYCVPTMSSWIGSEIGKQCFGFDPIRFNLERSLSGDDYCAFMGMYLSEGCLGTDNSIVIYQNRDSKGFGPYRALLAKMLKGEPRHIDTKNGKFQFGWRGLAEHAASFGADCYSKRIPTAILNATPRQQKIFWDYYSLGDGCISLKKSHNSNRPHLQEHIATTSKIMADQLQELAQKMGYAATILMVDAARYKRAINGIEVKSAAIRYDVYLKTSPMQSIDIEKTYYAGKIGCVTVPNGTLYVRRNGKAMWTGNSGVPNGMLVLKGGGWLQKQIDVLTRIWTNLKRGITKIWSLPVVAAPTNGEVELLNMQELKGTDVRYMDHMNMMIGALCTLFCFPPKRLGYKISGKGPDAQPVPESALITTDEDDPGLAPLLGHFENIINEYLIWPRWPDIKFIFSGKNPKEDARAYEFRRNAMTWGEARREADLPDLEEMLAELTKDFELRPEDAEEEDGEEGDSVEKAKRRAKVRIRIKPHKDPDEKKDKPKDDPEKDGAEEDGSDPDEEDAGMSEEEAREKADEQRRELVLLLSLCPLDPNLQSAFTAMMAAYIKSRQDAEMMRDSAKDQEQPGNRLQGSKDPAASEQHGKTSGVRRNSKVESARAGK